MKKSLDFRSICIYTWSLAQLLSIVLALSFFESGDTQIVDLVSRGTLPSAHAYKPDGVLIGTEPSGQNLPVIVSLGIFPSVQFIVALGRASEHFTPSSVGIAT